MIFLRILALCAIADAKVPYNRPPPANRTFHSPFVEEVIIKMKKAIKDPDLGQLFENVFPNTLDTTVKEWGYNDTFLRSGDIDGMWLRDSTQMVLPYFALMKYAPPDDPLRTLLRGLVMRAMRSVVYDPFANSFTLSGEPGASPHQGDLRRPPMTPGLFEGKYELDTLMHTLMMVNGYVKSTGDTSVLIDRTASLKHTPVPATNMSFFWRAANTTLWVMEYMQLGSVKHLENGRSVYQFMRDSLHEYDAWPREPLTPEGVGMIRTAFRPSDDETVHDFMVAVNAMALDQMENLINLCDSAQKLGTHENFAELKERARRLQVDISEHTIGQSLKRNTDGTVESDHVLVYETNGRCDPGKKSDDFRGPRHKENISCAQLQMDDSNYPSLLTLPLMGPKATTIAAQAPGTRPWVLSAKNPFYYCGSVGCGTGSPHTPREYIWPLGLLYRALTTSDLTEIETQLNMLKLSAEPTGWLHESFNASDVSQFTRVWFPWPNSLYGVCLLLVGQQFPKLIFGDNSAPYLNITNPF